jgi:hypothetical protein
MPSGKLTYQLAADICYSGGEGSDDISRPSTLKFLAFKRF